MSRLVRPDAPLDDGDSQLEEFRRRLREGPSSYEEWLANRDRRTTTAPDDVEDLSYVRRLRAGGDR